MTYQDDIKKEAGEEEEEEEDNRQTKQRSARGEEEGEEEEGEIVETQLWVSYARRLPRVALTAAPNFTATFVLSISPPLYVIKSRLNLI